MDIKWRNGLIMFIFNLVFVTDLKAIKLVL